MHSDLILTNIYVLYKYALNGINVWDKLLAKV